MHVQSLIDELQSRFGLDPSKGLQIVTTTALVKRPFDPGMATLIVPATTDSDHANDGFRPDALPGRGAHAESAAVMLRALYPPSHDVHALDGGEATAVDALTDAALASGPHYVPALDDLSNVASPHALPWLVARLRAPDGCPWDREQDHMSLRKFLLEETYEVYDALEAGSTPDLAEELGDLLLQIVLHAEYAAEERVFDMSDVYRNVVTKIVRRHPHVFGDVVAESAEQVIRNWEQIKAGERASRGDPAAQSAGQYGSVPAAFAGLSKSLPALAYAQEMQERAASLGYDWPSIEGVLDKVREEAAELVEAEDDEHRHEEFGDLLMVLVNLARKTGIDAESSLRAASAKFARRFAHVERQASDRQVELRTLSFEELDELWDVAKRETAAAGAGGVGSGGSS
ncbi:MAG: nucleoside triphosphate pyrophosphohydrolase [Candidatus Limnocylindrales bacterium]